MLPPSVPRICFLEGAERWGEGEAQTVTPPAGGWSHFLTGSSPCLPDTLCNELDQERKARYAIQQKLKGAEGGSWGTKIGGLPGSGCGSE